MVSCLIYQRALTCEIEQMWDIKEQSMICFAKKGKK